MSDTVEVEWIKRLDVRAGEVLVIRLPEDTDDEYAAHTAQSIRAGLPDGVRVLVLHGDIELAVVAAAEDGDDEE